MVQLVRSYSAMRPINTEHFRFFLSFRNSKCKRQPLEIHTIGGITKNIAVFLNLGRATRWLRGTSKAPTKIRKRYQLLLLMKSHQFCPRLKSHQSISINISNITVLLIWIVNYVVFKLNLFYFIIIFFYFSPRTAMNPLEYSVRKSMPFWN